MLHNGRLQDGLRLWRQNTFPPERGERVNDSYVNLTDAETSGPVEPATSGCLHTESSQRCDQYFVSQFKHQSLVRIIRRSKDAADRDSLCLCLVQFDCCFLHK